LKRILILLLLLTGALLPVIGPLGSAEAGSGSPNSCSSGWYSWRVPIMTSPITLTLEVGNVDPALNGWTPLLVLCYSTSQEGGSGPDTTGGSITLYDGYDDTARCTPQDNSSTVTTSCGWNDSGLAVACATDPPVANGACSAGGNASVVEEETDRTDISSVWFNTPRRITIPIWFCAAGTCASHTQTVTKPDAEVHIDVWPTTDSVWHSNAYRPSGTGFGTGTAAPNVSFCYQGSCQPVTSSDQRVGAGVNQSLVGTVGALICTPSGPPCAPGGFRIDDGDIAAVQVGTTVIPVWSTGPWCVSTRDTVDVVWEFVFRYDPYVDECP